MMYLAENRRFAEQIKVTDQVFSSPVVALELPPAAQAMPDAPKAFMLAANLLSHLFTKLHLIAPNLDIGPNPWQVPTLHLFNSPLSDVSEGFVTWERPARSSIVLGIGAHHRRCEETVRRSFPFPDGMPPWSKASRKNCPDRSGRFSPLATASLRCFCMPSSSQAASTG